MGGLMSVGGSLVVGSGPSSHTQVNHRPSFRRDIGPCGSENGRRDRRLRGGMTRCRRWSESCDILGWPACEEPYDAQQYRADDKMPYFEQGEERPSIRTPLRWLRARPVAPHEPRQPVVTHHLFFEEA